jgi:hypothetical protein
MWLQSARDPAAALCGVAQYGVTADTPGPSATTGGTTGPESLHRPAGLDAAQGGSAHIQVGRTTLAGYTFDCKPRM